MEEGQVGRLVRYKSGKTKLVLGETQFDLDIGMETGFLQVLSQKNIAYIQNIFNFHLVAGFNVNQL